MKLVLSLSTVIAFLLFSFSFATAHHMAEGTVDEEVYTMIDALVADTPHAELDEIPAGSDADMMITADSVQFLENMIDDGLLDYVGMLDGEVAVVIDFNVNGDRQSVYMTIYQYPSE